MNNFQEIKSQHQEEPYSLVQRKEKSDRKVSKRYGFWDMVSFALVASSRDLSCV
jgi:hypothetical protein